MKNRGLVILAVVTLALTGFYLMTERVFFEGSLGESRLMLKPFPSFEVEAGGGEEGTWAREHPDHPIPWWQSDKAVKLAYGGDWEDPVAWTTAFEVGLVLEPLLWLTLIISLAVRWIRWRAVSRKRLPQNPA